MTVIFGDFLVRCEHASFGCFLHWPSLCHFFMWANTSSGYLSSSKCTRFSAWISLLHICIKSAFFLTRGLFSKNKGAINPAALIVWWISKSGVEVWIIQLAYVCCAARSIKIHTSKCHLSVTQIHQNDDGAFPFRIGQKTKLHKTGHLSLLRHSRMPL